MNATAWIAIAGIVATLLAGLLSPVLADLYADLLGVTARFADNATTWSVAPRAALKEIDDQELDRIVSYAPHCGKREGIPPLRGNREIH